MAEEEYTLMDELGRKTMDALATLLTDLDRGAITRPQASYAISVLFQATSGLVGTDCFDLISEASKQVNDGMHLDRARRIFIRMGDGTRPTELILIEYQYGEAQLTIKRAVSPIFAGTVEWTQSKSAQFDHELDPFGAAHERFLGYARALTKQGFTEIE